MIKNAVTLLYGYVQWIKKLPKATGLMFAARTTLGRTVKIILFGIGVALPLGSLIWILLLWHGNHISRCSDSSASIRQPRSLCEGGQWKP